MHGALPAANVSNPTCFAVSSRRNRLTPVMLPPGRLRLATSPARTASLTIVTIGIVVGNLTVRRRSRRPWPGNYLSQSGECATRLIPKLADPDSCCERPPGHSLQKRTVVQWDMGAVLGRDGGTDESMSPQFGISSSAYGAGSAASADLGSAFGSGSAATGFAGSAHGAGSTASGDNSAAYGSFSLASGTSSVAIGDSAQATQSGAVALGQGATASAANSVAIGAGSVASASPRRSAAAPASTATASSRRRATPSWERPTPTSAALSARSIRQRQPHRGAARHRRGGGDRRPLRGPEPGADCLLARHRLLPRRGCGEREPHAPFEHDDPSLPFGRLFQRRRQRACGPRRRDNRMVSRSLFRVGNTMAALLRRHPWGMLFAW